MKILVFGSNGFIGKVLSLHATALGHEVVSFSRSTGQDIVRPETFVRELAEEKPDVVINLSALLGTMKTSPPIAELFRVNVMGNLYLLKASYEAGVRQYVFSSSLTVHGENKIGDHRGRFSLFNPKQGYGASKAAAEYAMQQFVREASDMKIVTLRIANVLGKGTELPHAPIEFIKTILAGKDVEIYGEGKHEREWIWIDDVAEGILRAVDFTKDMPAGHQPFFLSTARIAMCDLAEKIAQKLGGKVVFAPSTTQAFTLTSDYAESQLLLHWQPTYDIDAMINQLIAFARV